MLERRTNNLEVAAKYAEENLAGVGDELEETQTLAGKTKKLLEKNNIKLGRGLKKK